MRQGYLAAGFLAGLAAALSLLGGVQAQEQKKDAAPAAPAPDEAGWTIPAATPTPAPKAPPMPTIPVRGNPALTPVSASATTTILPAPPPPPEPPAPAKRRVPFWTTSSKQPPTPAAPPQVGEARGNADDDPLTTTPPPLPSTPVPPTAYSTSPAPTTMPGTPPPLPASSPTQMVVDVYVGVKQVEAGKPFLTGVLVAERFEFGGKKFLKFVKPENPQEYWLLDARVITAAQFRR